MKRSFVIAVALLIFGCDQRMPAMSDEDINAIRADYPGMSDVCLDKMRWGGIAAMPDATDQCFRMNPDQRWKGVWGYAFELSRFCPEPARDCTYDTPGDQIWLSFSPNVQKPRMSEVELRSIDFVGRETAERGHFGHLGMADKEIIVDRIISMKEIEAPPRPMVKK